MNLTFLTTILITLMTILKCSVDLEFEFNVTVDGFLNSHFYVVDFYSFAQFTRLNFVKDLTPESTSINISLEPLFFCLLFYQCFLMYF